MAEMVKWNPSTVVMPLGGGLWRLFSVPTRRNLVVTKEFLPLIDGLVDGLEVGELEASFRPIESTLKMAVADDFTLWASPHANSDLFDSSDLSQKVAPVSFPDFMDHCLEAGVLTNEWPPRVETARRAIGDRHRGNFYEQIGTEGLFRRMQPAQWWTSQKFNDDLKSLRNNGYKSIEEPFLDDYFAGHLSGKSVLDVGCGTGYFTRKIAMHAKSVIGLDFNPDYVEKASALWSDNASNLSFVQGDIINIEGSEVARKRFDTVVLIDTLLFLFDRKYQPQLVDNRAAIMRNVAGLLADGGRVLVMDPHPFWLSPWFGSVSRPVILLTEYRNRTFKTSPTLQEISDLFYDAGLRIIRILEPDIAAEYREIDEIGYQVMKEFPQWWFFELEKQ